MTHIPLYMLQCYVEYISMLIVVIYGLQWIESLITKSLKFS